MMNSIFSKRAENIKSSEIREILKLTSQSGIISFAGGLPSAEYFPKKELLDISIQVMKDMGEESLQYNTTEGYKPLRNQIAFRMTSEASIVKADSILITSGSQQGLDFTGKIFVDPGDIVFCESPSYLGAINAFRAYGAKFIEVETDEHGMNLEDLEEKIINHPKSRIIYVIPNFQNPTGRTWSLERRKGLIKLAKKYQKKIIEDNPYGELRYEGDILPSIYSLDKEDCVVYLGSFSKTFCPGLRIGWVATTVDILDKYTLVKQSADLHSNALSQRQLSLYLEQYNLDSHIENLVELYKNKRNCMVDAIRNFFPKNIKYSIPKGGLFLWVELDEKIDTKKLFNKSIDCGVAFVPGESFFPNGRKKNGMRLNFSNVTAKEIQQGIEKLGVLLEEY